MSLEIPFQLHGRSGKVMVEYGVNDDPKRWGCHLLGLPNHEISRGFPVIQATVDYGGEGYGATFGWVQIVRSRIGHGDEQTEVDQPPQLYGSEMPYCYWGPSPSFFDAPSMAQDDAIWTADAFLTATPDTVMTRVVRPVCGFRWGYEIVSGKVSSSSLVETPPEIWESARSFLKERYPTWEFRAE